MNFTQSRWEVKLRLSALKAGRRFQHCLCGLHDRVHQSRFSTHCLTWPDSRTGKEKDGGKNRDRGSGVGVLSVQQWVEVWSGALAPHSPWAWKLTGVGCVCHCPQLTSVVYNKLSFLFRYLCHIKDKNTVDPFFFTELKALKQKTGIAAYAVQVEHLIWIHSCRFPYA